MNTEQVKVAMKYNWVSKYSVYTADLYFVVRYDSKSQALD